MHAMLKADAPGLAHLKVGNDLPGRMGKGERRTHNLQTLSVSETKSGRVGGGSSGSFERSTGW